MIDFVLRFAKRLAVLVPGIVIAYFSVRDIFPLFDKRLPLAVAIFLTYIVGAYGLIPLATRGLRIIFPARHLPLYCVTPDGYASDPLNIGLIGTRQDLIRAMEAAGWQIAEPHSLRNILFEIAATLLEKPYHNAPMSSLYLFGRKQDIGFEIQLKGTRGHRHHVRFWGTTYDDSGELSVQGIHWQERKTQLASGTLLWVGAASRDAGLSFIKHNVQLTHLIDPDTDRERDLIAHQLTQLKLATSVTFLRLGKPYRLSNRAWRGYLQTDGRMHILKLKS